MTPMLSIDWSLTTKKNLDNYFRALGILGSVAASAWYLDPGVKKASREAWLLSFSCESKSFINKNYSLIQKLFQQGVLSKDTDLWVLNPKLKSRLSFYLKNHLPRIENNEGLAKLMVIGLTAGSLNWWVLEELKKYIPGSYYKDFFLSIQSGRQWKVKLPHGVQFYDLEDLVKDTLKPLTSISEVIQYYSDHNNLPGGSLSDTSPFHVEVTREVSTWSFERKTRILKYGQVWFIAPSKNRFLDLDKVILRRFLSALSTSTLHIHPIDLLDLKQRVKDVSISFCENNTQATKSEVKMMAMLAKRLQNIEPSPLERRKKEALLPLYQVLYNSQGLDLLEDKFLEDALDSVEGIIENVKGIRNILNRMSSNEEVDPRLSSLKKGILNRIRLINMDSVDGKTKLKGIFGE